MLCFQEDLAVAFRMRGRGEEENVGARVVKELACRFELPCRGDMVWRREGDAPQLPGTLAGSRVIQESREVLIEDRLDGPIAVYRDVVHCIFLVFRGEDKYSTHLFGADLMRVGVKGCHCVGEGLWRGWGGQDRQVGGADEAPTAGQPAR